MQSKISKGASPATFLGFNPKSFPGRNPPPHQEGPTSCKPIQMSSDNSFPRGLDTWLTFLLKKTSAKNGVFYVRFEQCDFPVACRKNGRNTIIPSIYLLGLKISKQLSHQWNVSPLLTRRIKGRNALSPESIFP